MERWAIIIIIIVIAFFLFWLVAGGQEHEFGGFFTTLFDPNDNASKGVITPDPSEDAMTPGPRDIPGYPSDKIIHPKSPHDVVPEIEEVVQKSNFNNNPKKKNSITIKLKTKNLMTLPDGIIPVEQQDEVLHDVMVLEEKFKGEIRKRVISKRYDKESKGEAICRHVLEDIYGDQFVRIRPEFLHYEKSNCNLELDGWCHKLKIGFEYNGSQHYRYNKYFHKSEQDLYKQVERDNWKFNKMNELGYYLITIPYTVPHSRIRQYIDYYLPENVIKRMSQNN